MVYLYKPYPAIPDIPAASSDALLTAPGTIAVVLPSLAPIVDIAASQWAAGELPDAQRIAREWWDDGIEVEGKKKQEEEQEQEEVEDGEIAEEPATEKSKGKRKAGDVDENVALPPVLTRAHYAPRVIALAKRLAARRGVKLCVDPKAVTELDSPLTTTTTTTTTTKPLSPPSPASPPTTPLPTASPLTIKPPTPETREPTPSSFSDTPTTAAAHPHPPLGKGMRGRARGRGTGRWAGHWQAKAAREAAAAREALKVGQVPVVVGKVASAAVGVEPEREEGPEAEKRRKREVGVALGNSSWWNHLLIEARKQRGPQWDDNTEMYQIDRGSALYYQSTRSPPKSPIELPSALPPPDATVSRGPIPQPPPASPRVQTRPTSSGRGSMAPPPLPIVTPANVASSLPVPVAPSPSIPRGSVPPVAESPVVNPAGKHTASPLLVTRPSPAMFPNGLPERSSQPPPPPPSSSQNPMDAPPMGVPLPMSMPMPMTVPMSVPDEMSMNAQQPSEETLAQARLQQQHILQRQMLAAQQARGQTLTPGSAPGGTPGGGGNLGSPMGLPNNLNPAAAAYLRQQGMTPQQMIALNMFAAQQRAQQNAQQQQQQQQQQTGSPAPNQPPGPNLAMPNRLPPHVMAQLAAQGFPNAGNPAPGGVSGMSSDQARAIMQMQTALYQQRMQGQNQGGLAQGQRPGSSGGGMGGGMGGMMGGNMQSMGPR